MKKIVAIVVFCAAAVFGFVLWKQSISAPSSAPAPTVSSTVSSTGENYKNGTYTIDNNTVTLVNGTAEIAAAPGSASKIVTQYFGNEATGDLNGDGVPDIAFLLTQSGGGSGTFFYVVAALKTAQGYQGTNAILLGDRIAPQNTLIASGTIIVNYAARNPGEPMTSLPSLGVTKYFKVQNGTLVEAKS